MGTGDINLDDPAPTYEQFAVAFTALLPALRDLHTATLRFVPVMRKYRRARHIAHAAYGLVRRGSQGWRKR